MATSYNGWSASPSLPLRSLTVAGVSFVPGIRDDDDVHTVLGYVVEQYAARIERLVNPGCWGFSYRANANNPNQLSNHASGTAVDVNAPQHPNGVPTRNTFTAAEVEEIHKILAEVDHVVRWGGDYTGTPDAMHFEINASKDRVAEVARKIRQGADDMPYSEAELKKIVSDAVADEFKALREHIDKRIDRAVAGEKARDAKTRERDLAHGAEG